MTALLRVRGLAKHFPIRRGVLQRIAGHVKAVDGVGFDLAAGETLAIVGESGCGKSTLGRLVLRLVEPTAGSVEWKGEDVLALAPGRMRALRRQMQIVFQDPYASLNPRLTVGEMIAEPLMLHGIATGRTADARVAELLGLVGLSGEHAGRFPHEFSGGQRQRIGIARALAAGPQLVVGDEPVSALDVSIRAQVINLLQDLQRRFGLAYLLIAHDLAVVKHIADRVAVMYLGRFVEQAPKAALFAAPRHPSTRALLAAIPVADPRLRRDRPILEGDVPSPMAPPPGCRFHTRCPFAAARCRVEDPAEEATADGHAVACHRWRDIGPAGPIVPTRSEVPANPRLAALQGAFRRPH
ncbi:MAG: dipeptide ABC transporter ATP-binding protein [Alphaproteobacteria bacterium]|nr:dipeptide ABC transporter ATP-binding protein [Alphaproteobacteria bacterium]